MAQGFHNYLKLHSAILRPSRPATFDCSLASDLTLMQCHVSSGEQHFINRRISPEIAPRNS